MGKVKHNTLRVANQWGWFSYKKTPHGGRVVGGRAIFLFGGLRVVVLKINHFCICGNVLIPRHIVHSIFGTSILYRGRIAPHSIFLYNPSHLYIFCTKESQFPPIGTNSFRMWVIPIFQTKTTPVKPGLF